MHLRGKDMTLTATLPDGRKQTLLNVPAYDFNWQLYLLPEGARAAAARHPGRSGRPLRQFGRTTSTIPDPDRGT